MIKRWIRGLILRSNIAFINFIRVPCDEEFIAVVHLDHLYISRGSLLYMCGKVEDVIGKIFAVPSTPPQTKE